MKMFSKERNLSGSLDTFFSNKWLLLVVSCSALDEGFIKGQEKLREEMKESRVWVGVWLGERMPNVTQGRKSLSSDVHFGPLSTPASLPNLFFVSYCLVLSLRCFVLSCLRRQADNKRSDRYTYTCPDNREWIGSQIVRDWH